MMYEEVMMSREEFAMAKSSNSVKKKKLIRSKSLRDKEKLNIWLLVVCILLVIALVIVIGLSLIQWFNANGKRDTYCTTEKCITSAASILDSIDRSTNPCDNFYDFVCGKWIKNNPLPHDRQSLDLISKLETKNHLVLAKLLEQPMSEMKFESEQKVKEFYDSCKNNQITMDKPVPRIVTDLLKELGGWSFDLKFNVKNWNLETVIHKIIDLNPSARVFFDWKMCGGTRTMMFVGPGGLTLPAEDYLKQIQTSTKLSFIKTAMEKFGDWSAGGTNLTQGSMEKVFEFETKLANITVQATKLKNTLQWEYLTLKELKNEAPFIDWNKYFQRLMGLAKMDFPNNDEKLIKITVPKYLRELNILVNEYQSDSGKKILHDYMIWQSFKDLPPFPIKEQPMFEFCVTETENKMPLASGAMFFKETFDVELKPLIEEMIREIKIAFIDESKSLDWIDRETRQQVKKKLDAMQHYIGYTNDIINSTELNAYYKDLEFKEKDYFANYLAVGQKNTRDNLKQEMDRKFWLQGPQTSVTAYHDFEKNLMIFLAGLMQSPFLEAGRPKSINYGAFGTIIGHELVHGFDNIGRQFDSQGHHSLWWTNAAMTKFNDQAQCLTKQYEKFEAGAGVHVNGTNTLGENIADNGGLRATYRAFLNAPKDDMDSKSLPGLNFTHQQLFFISYAKKLCSSKTNASLQHLISKDEHAPDKFRILGSLSNFEEFSKAFNCQPDSTMNPHKKCRVW